jgi:addiction module HigA family antidote
MERKISREIAEEERVYPPVHPGRIIQLEWLEPLEMSAYGLAKALGVPKQRIYELVGGRRSISADTALRLSRTLGLSPAFWMGLQTDYDLELAESRNGAEIVKEARPLAELTG